VSTQPSSARSRSTLPTSSAAATLKPWVFRVAKSSAGDAYEENSYDLDSKSSAYLIDNSNGVATLNRMCATFFKTHASTLVYLRQVQVATWMV
jgi:hypothetical protein